MSDNNSAIVSKVWSFCNTLRDDGVGYGDYLNQNFQDYRMNRITVSILDMLCHQGKIMLIFKFCKF